jgi:hypothetical protein
MDYYLTLTFKSEPKQMEIDDGFNYFGASSEKKASSFRTCIQFDLSGSYCMRGWDASGVFNFFFFFKAVEKKFHIASPFTVW